MLKLLMKFTIVAAAAGVMMYWEDVARVFANMTPLEMLDVIVTFMLKVVVLSIISYLLYTLPHIIKPWIKTYKYGQRMARRVRGVAQRERRVASVRAPRVARSRVRRGEQQAPVVVVQRERDAMRFDWSDKQ